MAWRACSLSNAPRVATAHPSGTGYRMPRLPSCLSVTSTGSSMGRSAPSSPWWKNVAHGRASTTSSSAMISPRQASVTGFQVRLNAARSV